jgi:hypothetical protein
VPIHDASLPAGSVRGKVDGVLGSCDERHETSGDIALLSATCMGSTDERTGRTRDTTSSTRRRTHSHFTSKSATHGERPRCTLYELIAASRSDAVGEARALGFYLDGTTTVVPMADVVEVGSVTLADGEPGVLHRFVAAALCDGGTTRTHRIEVKPFLVVAPDGDACVYRWEDVASNHVIHWSTMPIDRSAAILLAE